MAHDDGLETLDGIALLRVEGSQSFDAAVEHVADEITRAVEEGRQSLLVECRDITGFTPPSIASRHEMVRRWAGAARGRVCVAVVIDNEFIDPEKFGARAAANFGFTVDAFETVPDAVAWLTSQASQRTALQGG